METFVKGTGGWVRSIEAGRVRQRVAELSDSEALGFLAGGTVATLRWLVIAGDEVGRELRGLIRAVVAYRATRAAKGPNARSPRC